MRHITALQYLFWLCREGGSPRATVMVLLYVHIKSQKKQTNQPISSTRVCVFFCSEEEFITQLMPIVSLSRTKASADIRMYGNIREHQRHQEEPPRRGVKC